jgi:tetratricopeptide (TPR) repeat protein
MDVPPKVDPLSTSIRGLVTSLTAALCFFTMSAQGLSQSTENDTMRLRLESRVTSDPGNATSWRLLGRWQLKQGQLAAAVDSLSTAATLDPENAATQAALARTRFELRDFEEAAGHARRTIELAPETEYADESRQLLAELSNRPADEPASPVVQSGYEITRFDGSDLAPDPVEIAPAEPVSPLRLRIESGLVYNSNVTLTPINRELFPGKRDSGQLFLAPELEYRALDTDTWGAGPSFLGHFTVNEDQFQNLNLQSWQPGAFLERVFVSNPNVHVARLQYGYTMDAFDGQSIGNRHSVMASAATVWECQDLTFGYLSADHTNIKNDGAQPSVTGRDGWTYRVGAAHTFACDHRFVKSVKLGIDGEYADLLGTDFRYGGVSLYSAVEMPITESLLFKVEGGVGYRDYFDFDESMSPSRDETIWRAGCRLTKQLNNHWSIAGIFNYDQFDADNSLFAADRFLSGAVAIFEY